MRGKKMENLEFIVDKCVITVESEKGIKKAGTLKVPAFSAMHYREKSIFSSLMLCFSA
jgi:hypothetical protein